MTRGIDVSKHNGVIDWAKVRKNVDFAVIRAGYGRLIEQKDVKFEKNYAGAKTQGIPVGAYWYSYAHSVAEAQTEAVRAETFSTYHALLSAFSLANVPGNGYNRDVIL